MQELLTIKAAARVLGVSVGTVRSLLARRKIPFTRVGRCVRIDSDGLEIFIRANSVPQVPRGALRAVAGALDATIGTIRNRESVLHQEDWQAGVRLSQLRIELERLRQGVPARLEFLEGALWRAANGMPHSGSGSLLVTDNRQSEPASVEVR